jgi:S1-C subfamily serine protease
MKKALSVIAGALLAGTITCTQPACLSPNMAVLDSPIDIRPRQEYDARKDLEDILKSVHCVRTSGTYVKEGTSTPEVRKGYGTAFAYAYEGGYTYLVTSAHVVTTAESAVEIEIEVGPKGNQVTVTKSKRIAESYVLVDDADDEDASDDVALETVAKDKQLDIAVMRTRKRLHIARSYVKDYSIRPVTGDEVYLTGFPRGLFKAATKGMISHPDVKVNDERLDILDVTGTFGNSGSPYFVRRGDSMYWAGTVGKIFTYRNSTATMFSIGTPIRLYHKMLKGK